jgi:hypothetical protein
MGKRKKPYKRMGKLLKLAVLLPTMLLLNACAGLGHVDACGVFYPMSMSPNDTPETIAEIDAHNSVWEKLCER